jgi:tetratricopeptide (TPR) repeat protein/tRNA A-37 threonylcarbamoyl transferase component Bud32
MIGLTIGHYKILEELGKGRMGTVYKAQDLKRKRIVAVKVIPNEELVEERDRTRLLHEVQTATTLDHPSICQTQNVFDTSQFLFVVMNFVAGRKLSEVISDFPLDFNAAIDYAIQIASGLNAAHAANVYHRDLRSNNVIVTNVGGAKITDFGLGKLAEVARVTESEDVSLIVAYMSPEQLQGDSIDQQTDLWSLGVIMYEMIAGRRPFKGAEKAIMIDSIMNDEPAPLGSIRNDTPKEIERIVSKALAKDWEARYHTTDELLTELQAVQTALRTGEAMPEPEPAPATGRKIEMPKMPKIPMPKKPPIPKWKVFWIAAAAMVAAIAAIAFLRPGPEPPFAERDWAVVADFDNLTGEDDFGGALDIALAISLEQSTYINLVTRRLAEESLTRMGKTNIEKLDAATARDIAKREQAKAVIVPAIRSVGDSYTLVYAIRSAETDDILFSGMVEVDGRGEVFKGMDEMAQNIRADLGEPERLISQRSVALEQAATASLVGLKQYAAARDMHRHGDLEQAKQHYEYALNTDADFAIVLGKLGMLEYEYFDRNRGIEYINLASDLVSRTTEPEAYTIRAAKAIVVENDLDKAARIYENALAVYPDVATNHTRLASLLSDMGLHEDAVERYKEAIRVEATMTAALDGLASEYLEHLGRVDLATQWLRRQISHGSQSVWPYYHLAYACVGADKLDEAAEALEHAQKIDPEFTQGLELLGHVYRLQGRYGEALAAFDRQFSVDEEDVQPQYNKGVVYQKMGNGGLARDSYDRFRRIAQWRSEDNPGDVGYLFDLGLVLQRMGQSQGSAKAAQRAAALDSTAYFEWARLRSVQGRSKESLDLLKRAIDDGFRDLIILKYHPDFQAVRKDPQFAELLDTHLKS